MDNGYATLRCSLKVHPRCDACKRHAMEIISSIVGTYDVTLDSERKTATIVGQVDPNFCIRAIARCDGHAQVVWANLSHPNTTRYRGCEDDYDYGYDYSSLSSSYNRNYYGESLRRLGMYHEYPSLPEYSYSSGFNYDSFSRPHYYSNADESMSYCSIQ